MFEFELAKASATLENLNPRMEKHGGEKVPACTLKLSLATSADILAHFSPNLRAFLFNEDAPRDLAGGIVVRDHHMGYPLNRDEEMTGAKVTIDYGVSEKMIFQDCKVDDFKLTPRDGGSVIVGFRVACRPDESQIGKLYLLQEAAITLDVDPPEAPEMMKDAA